MTDAREGGGTGPAGSPGEDGAERPTAAADAIPCPFTYSNGRRCKGHIVRVEAYKADLSWELRADGTWSFAWGEPRSHFHLFCSEKGNHAGVRRQDALKLYFQDLPNELFKMISEKAR